MLLPERPRKGLAEKWRLSLFSPLACLLTSCGSTLEVTRLYDPESLGESGGIPFCLPSQEFVVSEIGLDEDGRRARVRPLRVSLVTRADPERVFLIRNSPGLFSESEFSITRDAQGVISALSARIDEKAAETVEELAALAVEAAGVAMAGNEQDRLEKELDVQRATASRLVNELTSADIDKVRLIQLALGRTRERIAELRALLRPSRGVHPSEKRHVSVEVAGSVAEVRERSKGVPARRIAVFLVPAGPSIGGGSR